MLSCLGVCQWIRDLIMEDHFWWTSGARGEECQCRRGSSEVGWCWKVHILGNRAKKLMEVRYTSIGDFTAYLDDGLERWT